MSDYFERIERQLVNRVGTGAPRPRRFRPRVNLVAPALSVVVVLAIVVVFLNLHRSTSPGAAGRGGVELVYKAEPTPQTPVLTRGVMDRAVSVMRDRLDALPLSGASVRVSASNEITARLPGSRNLAQATQQLGTTARLYFYDWEANVLLGDGKTVASLGPALSSDRNAITLSQGNGGGTGSAGSGSMNLYNAVKLASKQPALSNAACLADNCARGGTQYYLFSAPGSGACAIASKALGYTPVPGEHCLLSGPTTSASNLYSELPNRVPKSQGQVLSVPQGTVLLQAVPASISEPPKLTDPTTQFYVLKDRVALFGNDIANPRASTDQSGQPDVSFAFTSHGKTVFQSMTAKIANRGALISSPGQQYNQHFAVALDQLLVTVPYIDYKQNPDGIPGDSGADILAGFTMQSARALAAQLRLGALPINLKLIAERPLAGHGR